MLKFFVIATLLISVATANPIGAQWQETFYDYWKGASLPSNLPNWIIDIGTQYQASAPPHWGTGEVESFTAVNLAITPDQSLLITPTVDADGSWTSGRIETVSDFACTVGGKLWIEAQLKVGNATGPQALGMWQAFWALGSNFRGNYNNWPGVSEWDFFEAVNGIPKLYTTIHCGVSPGGPCNEDTGLQAQSSFTPGEWLRIAFEVDRSMTGPGKTGTWLDETLNWYVNEVLVFSLKGENVNNEEAWAALVGPHFLILDVAVGGSFPNAVAGISTPTVDTIDGETNGMEVFYVGVWNWY